MRKVALCLALVLAAIVLPRTSFASDFVGDYNVFIHDEAYGIRSNDGSFPGDMQIQVNIPVVSLPHDENLSRIINERIRSVYDEKLGSAVTASARDIVFRYEYKSYHGYGGILIYVTTTLNQVREEVVSINFDMRTGVLIDIGDLLGVNAVSLVNAAVVGDIRKSPDNFNTGFAGVGRNIDFYVENGYIGVLFDKNEIAPGSRGIVRIDINLNAVKTFVISDYLVNPTLYGLKLIPLGYVVDMLGYGMSFDTSSGTIELSKGDVTINCVLNENRYSRTGEPPISLEAPPELYSNTVFVPISFLDQVLDTVYTADYNNNITISYIDGD